MFKKTWVLALVAAAALLPAPPVHASELVKLAKLLVTGKRAPAASADAAKPQPARVEPERPAARHAEPSAAERAGQPPARVDAHDAPAAPSPEWQGQDRGESATPARPAPAEANPTRGDRFEVARDAAARKPLA